MDLGERHSAEGKPLKYVLELAPLYITKRRKYLIQQREQLCCEKYDGKTGVVESFSLQLNGSLHFQQQPKRKYEALQKAWCRDQSFSEQGQIVNISGSEITTQHCWCNLKAATGSISTDRRGRAPKGLALWPMTCEFHRIVCHKTHPFRMFLSSTNIKMCLGVLARPIHTYIHT